MTVRTAVIPVFIILLAVQPIGAQQASSESDVWRAFAEKLDPNAFVAVRLKDGRRIRGNLIQVSADALWVRPKTRIAVPLLELSFAGIESIVPEKEGMSAGKKVLIGVGIGVAAIWIGVLIALRGT